MTCKFTIEVISSRFFVKSKRLIRRRFLWSWLQHCSAGSAQRQKSQPRPLRPLRSNSRDSQPRLFKLGLDHSGWTDLKIRYDSAASLAYDQCSFGIRSVLFWHMNSAIWVMRQCSFYVLLISLFLFWLLGTSSRPSRRALVLYFALTLT